MPHDFCGFNSLWPSGTIWVRSRNCGCLVAWFYYQLIAKPGNKTATVPWPDPYDPLYKWVNFDAWPQQAIALAIVYLPPVRSSDIHTFELKSHEIAFAHNLLLNCQIVLSLCTEHGSVTAVPYANFQNDSTTDMDVMSERDLTRFRILRWVPGSLDIPYCRVITRNLACE